MLSTITLPLLSSVPLNFLGSFMCLLLLMFPADTFLFFFFPLFNCRCFLSFSPDCLFFLSVHFLPLESPFSLCVTPVWLWIVSPWFFLVLGHTLPTAIHHSPLECLDVDLNLSMSELEFSLLPRCGYLPHVPVSVLGSSVFPVRETRAFQVTTDFFFPHSTASHLSCPSLCNVAQIHLLAISPSGAFIITLPWPQLPPPLFCLSP